MTSEISKCTQSLTTAEDMRNQTKLMMHSNANWEEYLSPAPLSIAILGELVFISSVTDFSINKNPPKDGYQFIKYPDSFGACLMQVCNSGWWAFNEAHTSMDQIRLHTAQVPNYMKTAVEILFQDNDMVVNALLPNQLKNIQDIADECLKLSDATEKRFLNVINIIQELLEACKNAHRFYGKELEEVNKIIEENKLKKQSAEETKKRTEQLMNAMKKEMEEANDSYKKALNSLPNGWEMIGMDFVSGLTQGITGMFAGMASAITQPVNSVRDVFSEIKVYSRSTEMLTCAQNILGAMHVKSKDDNIDWTKLYDQKENATKTDFIAKQFERLSETFKEVPDCPAKQQALKLCKASTEICNKLAKYAPDGKCNKDKNTEIINAVFDLIESAHVFDCKSKDKTNSPAFSPVLPMMHREEKKSENISASQRATENARFKIEQTRAQLNKTQENYEKCLENLENNEKELNKTLADLRNCNLKEIDFKTTIQMLIKGMDAMGRVKEQWEKMVRFFQMVSNIVKTSLSTTLKNFVSTSENTKRLRYNEKLFSKDLLYIQAFQACNIASLVHMISATYTDISSKYLMDRVSSLGKLMAMDKTNPKFECERLLLQNDCDEAKESILKLVKKNKAEYDSKSKARIEKIDRELLAILPAASPKEIKSIEEAVEAGFKTTHTSDENMRQDKSLFF
ncbi:uncharacterized protein LOC122359888 [Puntigrus tetrazona]|uniref:uncharacterized protein LOC122359888 n=1 Tax=Puntigrus tetrazona TaxID=1606681 RepID=UPI001C8B097B|nr:uncharacterized protein LOC122359888 [Puntigrus tetrazona]